MSDAGSGRCTLSLMRSSNHSMYLSRRRCNRMPLQQTVGLPLANKFSVNVQIRIQRYGRAYQAYIQTDFSDWYSFSIQLTPEDIKELNAELQRAIEQVSGYFEARSEADTTELQSRQ